MALCPWNGHACDCTEFPWKIDGLIPRKCEMQMGLEMVPVRAVRPALKALFEEYRAAIKNKTYNSDDPKWDRR